jgi:hypothetical protein
MVDHLITRSQFFWQTNSSGIQMSGFRMFTVYSTFDVPVFIFKVWKIVAVNWRPKYETFYINGFEIKLKGLHMQVFNLECINSFIADQIFSLLNLQPRSYIEVFYIDG